MSKAQFDNQREDALLVRLKQCVGQIKNNNKDNNMNTSTSYRESYRSKQTSSRLQPLQKHQHPQHIIVNRLNLTQTKQNKQNQPSSQLKLRKAYICDQTQPFNEKNSMTDRKSLYIGFNQRQQIDILKERKGFSNYQGRKCFNQVTQSTKKRITQRQSLVHDHSDNYYSNKDNPPRIVRNRDQKKQKLDDTQESLLLQRFQMRSRKRALDKEQSTTNKEKTTISKQKSFSIQRDPQIITLKHYPSIEVSQKNNEQDTYQQKQKKQRFHQQTYQSYTPQVYSNRPLISNRDTREIKQTRDIREFQYKKSDIRDIQYKKSDKLEKLNKISQMNQQINNRIRKIVSTFQGYLEHKA